MIRTVQVRPQDGNPLATWLARMGWSQAALIRECERVAGQRPSPMAVSSWARGASMPTAQWAEVLAIVTGGAVPATWRYEPAQPMDPLARLMSHVAVGEGCWEWQGSIRPDGYGQTMLRKEGRKTIVTTAHRLSWRLHNGPIPAGLWVLHHCDNRRCIRPDHLFLGTREDNTNDMLAKGRQASGARNGSRLYPERLTHGEDSPRARLTWAQVDEIRRRHAAGGVTYATLAREMGVSEMTVARAARRQSWKMRPALTP